MKVKKVEQIVGDLCINIGADRVNDFECSNLISLITECNLKIVALNQTYVVPETFVTKNMDLFPQPIKIPEVVRSRLKKDQKIVNRVTFQLQRDLISIDNLMHALTKKTTCSQFDLIAIRPAKMEQLYSFFKCNNVVYDILCMDHYVSANILQSFRPEIFQNAMRENVFYEIQYFPVQATCRKTRCNALMACNALMKFSKRFCRNFIFSSGAGTAGVVTDMCKLKELADMCGFSDKLFNCAISSNIERCLEEASFRRSLCPAVSVKVLTPEMESHWTYDHASKRRIDQYLSGNMIAESSSNQSERANVHEKEMSEDFEKSEICGGEIEVEPTLDTADMRVELSEGLNRKVSSSNDSRDSKLQQNDSVSNQLTKENQDVSNQVLNVNEIEKISSPKKKKKKRKVSNSNQVQLSIGESHTGEVERRTKGEKNWVTPEKKKANEADCESSALTSLPSRNDDNEKGDSLTSAIAGTDIDTKSHKKKKKNIKREGDPKTPLLTKEPSSIESKESTVKSPKKKRKRLEKLESFEADFQL